MANQYNPDYVSPPGETLLETIQTIGMSQAQLAERTGRPKKTINEIIKGKASITPETAIQLERVLGIPASFWNNRENHYREALAQVEEQERLQKYLGWLKNFPIGAMVKKGWIKSFSNNIEQLQELLSYFGVVSPDQWENLWGNRSLDFDFRKSPSFQTNNYAVAAWLRKGELEAQSIRSEPFDSKKFKDALLRIRSLTNDSPEIFVPRMVRMCAESGVILVFVSELPATRLSGATTWISNEKAVIALSLRYGSDDHLWFTLFHEAGHILLHSKKATFIEHYERSKDNVDLLEQEANKFACNMLIPRVRYRQFVESWNNNKAAIIKFASEMGISSGIVVGRLQHDGYLPYNRFNDLKKRFVLNN